MPCYHPLKGFRSKTVNKNGKRPIVFDRNQGYADRPVTVPCGRCIGCRLEKSRQWAMRCVHEAQMHERNCFITLTFDDEKLQVLRNDSGGNTMSLDVRDMQLFMKRLRKKYEPNKIRFFHCGEYGEERGRPHYHAILFGHDFKDKEHFKTINGEKLYISEELTKLWPHGFSSIGDVTFNSAAYVARYVNKKVTGEKAEEHYEYINLSTGQIFSRKPEYATMSRDGGIGASWYEKYQSTDVYAFDQVVIRGKKMKPPKYYDRKYEEENASHFKKIRMARLGKARDQAENNTPARLKVREKIQLRKLEQLPRNLG